MLDFRVPLLILLAICSTSLRADESDPWTYFGLYQFADGRLIHGGLLEEADSDIWIFSNPEDATIGGVFRKESETSFVSLVKPAQTLKYSDLRNGAYRRMVIADADAPDQAAQRIPAFKRRDVSIPASHGSIAGSLLVPTCAAPHPLIVFVNGSGYTSRHIGPFASYTLSQGMALLSYDKRDGDSGMEGWQEQSLLDIGNDAAAALAWAAAQPDIDSTRAGILASSQGGWTGPVAAVSATGADFLIVRAGPGVSELETNLFEQRNEWHAKGLSGADLEKSVELLREAYALAERGESIEATDALVAPWRDTRWYRTAFGDSSISQRWSARWWRWAGQNLAFSAIPYLERYPGPVLWFLGAEDENVPLVSSYAALTRTFAKMPGSDQRLVVLPDAPHSFVIGMNTADAHYAPDYYPVLGQWLAEHSLSRPDCLRKISHN